MRTTEHCGMSYVRNGDIAECRLPTGHPHTCPDANHDAFIAGLHARTIAAQNEAWL